MTYKNNLKKYNFKRCEESVYELCFEHYTIVRVVYYIRKNTYFHLDKNCRTFKSLKDAKRYFIKLLYAKSSNREIINE